LRLLDRLVNDPPASLGVQMPADENSWNARSSRSRISNQTDISSIRNIVKAASNDQIDASRAIPCPVVRRFAIGRRLGHVFELGQRGYDLKVVESAFPSCRPMNSAGRHNLGEALLMQRFH
jgi:hypothetical protein